MYVDYVVVNVFLFHYPGNPTFPSPQMGGINGDNKYLYCVWGYKLKCILPAFLEYYIKNAKKSATRISLF